MYSRMFFVIPQEAMIEIMLEMLSLYIGGGIYRLIPHDNLSPKMRSREHCTQTAFRELLNQNLSTEKSIIRSQRLQRRGLSA